MGRSRSSTRSNREKEEAPVPLDALRQSEAKYRRLHETRIDAFVSVSMDGRIQEFNELFPWMVGYSADELRTLTYRDLTPEKWHAIEEEIVRQQVLVRGHSDIYQKEYRRKDGTIFPVELRTIVMRDAAGTPIGMWAVVRDITARREAEQALIESREALAGAREALLALINSTTDLIWSVDPHTFGLITFNDALRRYFAGQGIDLRPGMTPSDLLPADFAERWRQFYSRALRGDPFVEYYATSSKTRALLLSFNLVQRAGTVSAIAVFGKDITADINSQEALRESEQRFRQIAESVSDFIWEVDADGLYTYTNPAVEKILGYTPAELVGRKHFYDLFEEKAREELKRGAFEAFASKRPFRAFPNANISKDGRLVRLETSGVPLLDQAGALVGYRGADSDVTERWLNEQALRDLTGRLINAQEAERARLAGELHDDFCQRLALLAINIYGLAHSPPESADALRTSLNGLYTEVNALAQDAHRMSHDLHPARLEQLGLAEALGGLCRELATAHMMAIHYQTRGVPREVAPPVALCLYRVAQEALQNVIKHSGATTAAVELTVGPAEIHLRVQDDGCGFDVAAVERGDSLGIANMRERVRSIAGRFAITCAPGQGTRIDVQAPLTAPPAAGGRGE